MTNRQEIEKRFDETFDYLDSISSHNIKSFFFDEILPDILESVLTYEWNIQWDEYDFTNINDEIKRIAKEKYNIIL